ncbi:MAG: Crp/Fnr family transcriptional regulator [Arenicellales bacterium]|nr:Crp/Fnr family transcriptional regulator [Gammaproteobacteria bacterium]NDG43201.1 Crp/Fnr family transcriptional regulator [Gammaproteobacteria bacterium]
MANARKRRLDDVLDQLTSDHFSMVAEFAEFLRTRQGEPEPDLREPVAIPRPAEESVIAAIRRLSKTYPMLAKDDLFNEASSLMTQHLMHGESGEATIDRLEAMFKDRYEAWTAERVR